MCRRRISLTMRTSTLSAQSEDEAGPLFFSSGAPLVVPGLQDLTRGIQRTVK
jgi:hypothetical protein